MNAHARWLAVPAAAALIVTAGGAVFAAGNGTHATNTSAKVMHHWNGKHMGAYRAHREGGMMGATVLSAAATYLGISTTALETDLKGGKTLADVANSEAASNSSISVSGLEAAIVSAITAKVTAAVDSLVTKGLPTHGARTMHAGRGRRHWSSKSGSSPSGSSSSGSSSSGSSSSSSSSTSNNG